MATLSHPRTLQAAYRISLETGACVVATTLLLAIWWKIGIPAAFLATLLVGVVVLGLASPRAFAVAVVILAPIPSIADLVYAKMPFGVDPLNILVVLGVGVAAQQAAPFVLGRERRLVGVLLINLGLLIIAWYRTYGQGTLDVAALGRIVEPLFVLAAGLLVVQLLPQRAILPTLALGMAVMLAAVEISIVAQRFGLYRTPRQDFYNYHQYGGIILTGFGAGMLLATFAVPVFLLLRAIGRPLTGIVLLVGAIPVLLITLSRAGIITFGVSLLLLALLDRRRLSGAKVALALGVFAAGWVALGGTSKDVSFVEKSFETDLNGQLNGRPQVWKQVFTYLDSHHAWIAGGGLDDFRKWVAQRPLEYAVEQQAQLDYTTHNLALRLVTDGGLIMATALVLLLAALWGLTRNCPEELGLGLKIAVISYVLIGVTSDYDLFARTSTWFWIFAAAAARMRTPVHARRSPAARPEGQTTEPVQRRDDSRHHFPLR